MILDVLVVRRRSSPPSSPVFFWRGAYPNVVCESVRCII